MRKYIGLSSNRGGYGGCVTGRDDGISKNFGLLFGGNMRDGLSLWGLLGVVLVIRNIRAVAGTTHWSMPVRSCTSYIYANRAQAGKWFAS